MAKQIESRADTQASTVPWQANGHAIPYGLRDYVSLWANTQVLAGAGRLQDLPTDPAAAEDVLLRRKIPIDSAALQGDPSQWPVVAARVQVDASIPKRVETLTRHAGLCALGSERSAMLYGTVAEEIIAYTDTHFPAWSTVSEFIETVTTDDAEIMPQLQKQIDNLSGRKGMTDEARRDDVRKWLIDTRFERQILRVGQEFLTSNIFDPTEQDELGNPRYASAEEIAKSFDRGVIIRRIDTGVVEGGEQWQQNLSRQVEMYRALGGTPGVMLYETPQTKLINERLREAELVGSEISWLVAEGAVEVAESHIERLRDYATVEAYAKELIYGLLMQDATVQRRLKKQHLPEHVVHELTNTLQNLAHWKIPDAYPRLPALTNAPLIFSRPDLARVEKDGKIEWVATELENAPGGLGMLLVAAAGYETDNGDELLAAWQTMFQDIGLPSETIDRNNLTIVMSEDWGAYRTEMQLFLTGLQQKYGLNTHVVTIEELAEGAEVPPGFVFHFAYPWNFIKDNGVEEDLSEESEHAIFVSSEEQAMRQRAATEALYNRHGKDIHLFNDPSFGLLMYSKVGMSMYHLPGFSEVLGAYLEGNGISESELRPLLDTFYNVVPQTLPLLHPREQGGKHVERAIGAAIQTPENSVVKLAYDPLGQEDWGARGVTHLPDVNDTLGFMVSVRDAELPFVLQNFITHARWEEKRIDRDPRVISGEMTEQVVLYNNDPVHHFLRVGEGAPQTVAARWNPFFLTYRGRDGEMVSQVISGSMTLTPITDGQYKVHGTSTSAEVPVVTRREKYDRAA